MKYTWKVASLRAILFASCVLLGALLAYNSLVVYPSFTRMLTQNTEEEAARIARYLMDDILHEGVSLRVGERAVDKIMDAKEDFHLWKLKIFGPAGETVYSTDPAEIGTVTTSEFFKERLPRGETISQIVKKDGRSSEGQRMSLDITETYVPILREGNLLGVFEIYNDITERKARQETNLMSSTAVSFTIALLFFGVLIFILERTGKSIVERRIAEERLRQYQDQLVQTEKMASLGGLVAGIAHEINTPVGAAVTVASTLDERTRRCRELLETNLIKRSDLQKYFETASSSSAIILTSLRQAANIIKSFKQVAVDQSCEERRTFHVRQSIEDVLLSLKPKLRQGAHRLHVNCPEDIEITNFPGALSQIFTNLVMNSITHAFFSDQEGEITFEVWRSGSDLLIRYADDGCGMDGDTLNRIFEPFFTTKRGQGGSGLGLHIVYNLVSQTLGGSITCDSVPGRGTTFLVTIPAH